MENDEKEISLIIREIKIKIKRYFTVERKAFLEKETKI